MTVKEKTMKIQWRDVRKNVNYITNTAFADIPENKLLKNPNYKPTFTIKDYDHDGLISMERVYLEHSSDPTEYTFVEDVFDGDMKHWEMMKNAQYVRKHYQKWKQKAEAKLLSDAMTKIVETAFDANNKNSFQALKYLVERKAVPAETPKRGRPKKVKEVEEIDSNELLEDIKRLRGEI